MNAPVWITGVGTCTPAGDSLDAFADAVLAGRCCLGRIDSFDVSQHPCRVAGPVRRVPRPPGEGEEFDRLPRLERLARWCCSAALCDAGLWAERRDLRVGLVLGLGSEWLLAWEAEALREGVARATPGGSSLVARTKDALSLTGPAVAVSAACASGNAALQLARSWLRLGWADVCLAGAADAAVTPTAVAGFGNLRALTRRDDPASASRPFDRDRDGFVLSEGGAVFVLQREADARRRGATAYAEVAGCGASSDAHDLVMPNPDPTAAARAVRRALADAALDASGLDYVNAHATSTPVGDAAEANVLRLVLGASAGRVPVSGTKGATGHLLTAAAAAEVLACLAAMRSGHVPPTRNLESLDPACAGLCHVAGEARAQRVRVAASNSFGFGGSNTCVVLRSV